MEITDINVAGASAIELTANVGLAQLVLSGTWAGANVALQKFVASTETWQTIQTFTDDGMWIVEHIGGAKFRTFTTGTPTIVGEFLI